MATVASRTAAPDARGQAAVPRASPGGAMRAGPRARSLLALQRTAGNRRVTRLLAREDGAGGAGGQGATACPADQVRAAAAGWIGQALAQLRTLQQPGGGGTQQEGEGAAAAGGGQGDSARITRTMQRTFRTTDPAYVRVVVGRLEGMQSAVRGDRLTVQCGGAHCSAAGSGFTAAYVVRANEMVLCGTGTGPGVTRTFVHEMAHAVLPAHGITLEGDAARVTDRAYAHERLFRRMTPDEALDNADSYGYLVAQLAQRLDQDVATGPVDTAQDCADEGAVLDAMARVGQQHRVVTQWLDGVIAFLEDAGRPGRTVADLPAGYRTPLQRHFPAAVTAADVRELHRAYVRMQSPIRTGQTLRCVTGGRCRDGDILGVSTQGHVTAGGARPGGERGAHLALCPAWAGASEDVRVRSLFNLMLLTYGRNRLPRGTAPAALNAYAALAADATAERLPPPEVQGAEPHLAHEQRRQARDVWYESANRYMRALGSHVRMVGRAAEQQRRAGRGGAPALTVARVGVWIRKATSIYRARPTDVPRGYAPPEALRAAFGDALLALRAAAQTALTVEVTLRSRPRSQLDRAHAANLRALQAATEAYRGR